MNPVAITRFPPLSYAGREAMNTLCTNLSFAGDAVKKIMLTSCHPNEGKSFVSMNLMRSLAQNGKSVVLVDTDLRKSVLDLSYGIRYASRTRGPGMVHYLAGMTDAESILYSTDIPNAFFVPAGRDVLNSLPLLGTPKFSAFLDDMAQRFQYIIVDSPPVGTIIDAAEIAKSCDGVLLVINYNAVRRREALEAKAQLLQSGCPILGTVLNGVEYDSYITKKYYYRDSSYYASDYGEEASPSAKPRRKRTAR